MLTFGFCSVDGVGLFVYEHEIKECKNHQFNNNVNNFIRNCSLWTHGRTHYISIKIRLELGKFFELSLYPISNINKFNLFRSYMEWYILHITDNKKQFI
jgi:hypothetical protein